MAQPLHKYPVEQCDVEDQAGLVRFRAKLEEWNGWLFGGENGIWRQIHHMLWNDAIFRMVNETRRFAAEDDQDYATQAGWLAEIIDQGFFATQLLALRRLTEPSASRPHKQIISAVRLLEDIERHIDLFTRENFVSHDALPYYPDLAEVEFWKAAPEGGGVWTSEYLGPTDFSSSRRSHERFNRLSGRGPGMGERQDLMGARPLEEMWRRLDSAPFKAAAMIANKRIAHSPDPSSIPKEGIPTMTFAELWDCQRTVVEVVAFVGTFILQGGSHGAMPIPQHEMFSRWDRPFMPPGSDERLQEVWKTSAAERDRWSHENSWEIFEVQFPVRQSGNAAS